MAKDLKPQLWGIGHVKAFVFTTKHCLAAEEAWQADHAINKTHNICKEVTTRLGTEQGVFGKDYKSDGLGSRLILPCNHRLIFES